MNKADYEKALARRGLPPVWHSPHLETMFYVNELSDASMRKYLHAMTRNEKTLVGSREDSAWTCCYPLRMSRDSIGAVRYLG
jgi:hypothetical protein